MCSPSEVRGRASANDKLSYISVTPDGASHGTRSSAVAERPRDVSCLSAVSFKYNTLRTVFYYYTTNATLVADWHENLYYGRAAYRNCLLPFGGDICGVKKGGR